MNAFTGTSLTPLSTDPIIVLGNEGPLREAMAKEIEALPTTVVCATSLSNAGTVAASLDRPPSVVLIPEAEIRPDEFESELAELRVRVGSPQLVPIAFGRAPDDERRREIRQAGVDLALFGRFGRHALRFQINRALSPWADRAPRGERRAPKEWRTRTYSSGKEKSVRCYSLSTGGAYFVTPRPWVVGSNIELELPVGRERLLVSGKILYTNEGNHDGRRALPSGMAVAFRPLSEHIREVIREDVTATHEALQV